MCVINLLYSVFTLHIGSIMIFLEVVLETRKFLIYSFIHLSDIPKQLLIKGSSGKKIVLLSRFQVCKASVKGSYLVKLQASFPQILQKITITVIFQCFYLDFNQFSIHAIFPEYFSMADFVNLRYIFSN